MQGFTLSPTTSNNNLELSNVRLNVPIGAIFAVSAWQVNGSASHKTVQDPQFTSFNSQKPLICLSELTAAVNAVRH